MEVASQPKLTIDEFFKAISGADERYELINGVAYAMAGAKEGHNVICSNVFWSPSRRTERKWGAARHPAILPFRPARTQFDIRMSSWTAGPPTHRRRWLPRQQP
jgi:Uma2 family endonuclease